MLSYRGVPCAMKISGITIPGIPRPQFLGSLRTTPKVRERPQKCNFGSANKGLPNMFSSMPLFLVFCSMYDQFLMTESINIKGS